jgi:hypothetical protein
MRKLALTTLACFLTLGALAARGDDDKDKKDPKEAKDGETITVFKPYSKLEDIFDENGGVFLPSKELEKLIEHVKALEGHPTQPVEVAPPAPFVHVASRYKGSADESVARFEGTFDFEVLEKKKWVEIPLGLSSEVSLEEAKTGDGKRAVVQIRKDGTFAVLVQGAGPLTVTARFTVPVKKDRPGQRSFELKLGRAALSTFEVDLPEKGLRVDVAPSLGLSVAGDAADAKTHVTAYLGSGEQPVTVTWYPRPKDIESNQKPLVFSTLDVALRLDEGVAKAFVEALYNVEQAPTDTFRLTVPAGWKILPPQADGMREHEVTESAGVQVLRVSFHERVKQAAISFRLERARDDQARFQFPIVKTLDVERETGLLAAGSSSFLKLEAGKVTGLSQVDPGEIPARLMAEVRKEDGERPPLGFRFLKNDGSLDLQTATVEPEVEGKVYSLATIKDDEISYAATIVYEIKKRGIFGVKIKLPVGFTNVDCGDESTVKSAVPRDALPAEKWAGQVLDVDFARQAKPGTFVLRLTGSIPRRDPAAKLAFPLLALDGVTKETGLVAMAAQKHLKLTQSGQPTGLVSVAAGELPGLGFPYAAQESEELVYGFKYGKPGAQAAVEVAKREPKVTTNVEIVANADLDRINVEGDIHYKVEFAGIDHVRIEVPKELKTDNDFKLTSDGAAIKEKKCGEPKDGKVVWDVELQSKREGVFKLHFKYEVKLTDMSAGQVRDVALYEVVPLDTFHDAGDIVLLKHENLVISDGKTDGLETRHPTRELPESLAKLGGFRGYHYVTHPWTLELHVIKYDFQAPLGKIVEHLHLDEVVLRDGTIQAEAWIELKNNQSQFLRILMPKGSEVFSPVLVSGKELSPSKFVTTDGQAGIDVMLPEETRRAEVPVLVRMRYQFREPRSFSVLGSLELDAPTFPTDDRGAASSVPVARFTRNVWLPDKVCYTDFDTDMTTHFERGGLFESAKRAVFEHMREEEGAAAALQAVDRIHGMATSVTGSYPPLEHPTQGNSGGGPRLFEKLDGQAHLSVVYASWPALYGLGVLALAFVVALGGFLESRKIVTSVSYFAVSAGTTFFLAVVASRSYEPFLATAFTGSLGIGSFWFIRACWYELTIERHRRHLEALSREAEVAKARAAAAEAEARAATRSPTPPPAPKGGSAAEGQGGEKIGFDESLKRDLPAADRGLPPPATK